MVPSSHFLFDPSSWRSDWSSFFDLKMFLEWEKNEYNEIEMVLTTKLETLKMWSSLQKTSKEELDDFYNKMRMGIIDEISLYLNKKMDLIKNKANNIQMKNTYEKFRHFNNEEYNDEEEKKSEI